jgi:hypothetical protein
LWISITAADQRKALERREGDREEAETEAERMEEKEMIKKSTFPAFAPLISASNGAGDSNAPKI